MIFSWFNSSCNVCRNEHFCYFTFYQSHTHGGQANCCCHTNIGWCCFCYNLLLAVSISNIYIQFVFLFAMCKCDERRKKMRKEERRREGCWQWIHSQTWHTFTLTVVFNLLEICMTIHMNGNIITTSFFSVVCYCCRWCVFSLVSLSLPLFRFSSILFIYILYSCVLQTRSLLLAIESTPSKLVEQISPACLICRSRRNELSSHSAFS